MFTVLVKRPEFFHGNLQPGDTIEGEDLPTLIEGLFPGYCENLSDESRYAGRVIHLTKIAFNLQAEEFKKIEDAGEDPFGDLGRDEVFAVMNDKKTGPLVPPLRAWNVESVPLYLVVDVLGGQLPAGNVRFLNAETETLFLRSLAFVDLIEIYEKKD